MQMKKLIVAGCAAVALCAALTADAEDRALYNAEHLLAYWPLNSASKVGEEGDDAYYADASGNDRQLAVCKNHVTLVSDSTACDGEYAHMDGNGSYLKSKAALPLSSCAGLTFFFRIQGALPADSTATVHQIFETTVNYNDYPGAVYVSEELRNGKWYLCVSERVTSSAGYSVAKASTPLDEKIWQNVVIVFAKQDSPHCFEVYVDGCRREMEIGHNGSTKKVSYVDDTLYIGGRAAAGTLVGNIDEFGVYDYAMGSDEVTQLTADIAGAGGVLLVVEDGGRQGAAQPAIGAHAGYVEGENVTFNRDKDGVPVRGWTLITCVDGQLNTVKRGYGHCGTFTHTGGKMCLRWEIEGTDCRWSFDDGTGRNEGSRGAVCDLEFSGTASATDGYLFVPKEESAFASTKSALDLSRAGGLTSSFWVRKPAGGIAGMLVELSSNYTECNGSFFVSYNSETHVWSAAVHGSSYSVVGYGLAAEDDAMMDGLWHHVAVVFRKAVWPNSDIYVDGSKLTGIQDTQHKLNTTDLSFASNQKLYLCGRDSKNSTGADLDNVTIHTRALTAADVATAYLAECEEMGKAAVVPEGFSTLVVTAKKAMPQEDLPIPGFGKTCICTEGETLSFDFTRGPYTVEGGAGKCSLTGWTLYRLVEGEWTACQSGKNPLVEFVHPGGQVKLELKFSSPGMMLMVF